MYVKSLTLKGFKSFADTTTLDLEEGVNVVVGPNGSGKSNVIDAVAWVLGAQGARALRGGKMDDVIFAGTAKRQALGRAEVSLVIDNSDQRIPVEFSEVTISRTLFRTGESEYAINGVPCRLLDIQELLSDSGVGRQQHVIVSQGNLDAVLTARPEDRRMIIEEAAGVLKYRKRREKSQRRLEATEQNFERLQDLVREVRSQMRPLQKQANAAMRYDAVVSELRQLKLFTIARDMDALAHRFDNANAEFAEIDERGESLRDELQTVDTHVQLGEAQVAAQRNDGLDAYVERLESAYHRARGRSGIMTERRKTFESELNAAVSKDVVAQLEHDAANVVRDLETVGNEHRSLDDPFAHLATREEALSQAWKSFEQEWGEGLPMLTNEAAELRGASTSLSRSLDATTAEIARREQRLHSLRTTRDEQVEALALARERSDGLNAEAEMLNEQREDVVRDAEAHAERLTVAQDRSREADEAYTVAHARVEALTSALDASRARAGAERLSSVKGVLGTLLDLVEVEPAYQSAFEAAAGEALAAVIVKSVGSARDGISTLLAEGDGGAVLPLEHVVTDVHGAPEGCPAVGLRQHVRGMKKGVDALLDRLLCCCVVVDGPWEEGLDVSLRFPELVVVTTHGDRFSRAGWRVGNNGVGTTMAAVNQAEQSREHMARVRDELREVLREVSAEKLQADAAVTLHRDRVNRNTHERGVADAARSRAQASVASIDEEITTISDHVARLRSQLADETAKLDVMQLRLPELEKAEATGEERARLWREARGALEGQAELLRNERRQLEVRRDALVDRETYLTKRHEQLTERLERHHDEVAHAALRREQLWGKIHAIEALGRFLEERIAHIASHLGDVRAMRDEQRERQRELVDRLETARRHRAAVERELMEIAESRQGIEVRQAELRMRIDALSETLTGEMESTLEIARSVDEPELPKGRTAKQRVAELERDLRQMGPINPLAIEEYKEIEQRHQFLDQQLQDIQQSRRELARVIRSVDAEIVDVFQRAFDDVAGHFATLFAALFPGGSGRLRLTDPENLLETGIEIDAKPSGKNVRTLSLLSGGERSLVALAFLFAVFRSRPSPFYLLDEVEAALDDHNLSRFLRLIQEFRSEAQLVIVSHQKRTMETADCLYGVSMQPGGSSKVVSERVTIDVRDRAGAHDVEETPQPA